MDYTLPIFDKYREWIRAARENNNKWEDIKYGLTGTEEGLKGFLDIQAKVNFWNIDEEAWMDIVNLQIAAEKNTVEAKYKRNQAILIDDKQDSNVSIPNSEKSAWQLYKSYLIDKGFDIEAVNDIERSSLRILRRLNIDTREMKPVKGLVIGNVQSGKTANMAALMAMAADWGWNMFIVLSGTIENLRQQTQRRLYNDLTNKSGNINWKCYEHLSKKSTYGQRAQDLRLEDGSSDRHFTVCLKNSTRLKNLIDWLQMDVNKQKQMKILVIDDEADQASINTADITTKERKAINKLMVNLVEGKNKNSKTIDSKYRAMNYIGYTATPYANILNEASDDSLYPRSFISTLSVSNQYFGPQQIFGAEGMDYDGLNIVREIDIDELESIKEIHNAERYSITSGLKKSICWFLCGSATMRYWGYKKPISMLVHTSQKQDHHGNVASVIDSWISSCDKEKLLILCEEIWKEETEKFTFENFKEQYPNYGISFEKINKYPQFSEIREEIKNIISIPIANIKLDEEGELEYHDGIHLCIDNCRNSGINEEGMYVRLAYPEGKRNPAPIFIVIGGATLSRGLTIEGLISTYFLRSVGQADTLMQMGRWFGYRKSYELIPRIWITEKTRRQFEFLSALDQELRDEIVHMDTMGHNPSEYGPKVKNTPMYSFIRITGKNKMQSATETSMNYSGAMNQTTVFDNNFDILSYNKNITVEFINSLGDSFKKSNCASNSLVWRGINYKLIFKELLMKIKFNGRNKVFNDIESVEKWIEKATNQGYLTDWNVVLSGREKASTDHGVQEFKCCKINKVERSRKKLNNETDIINIGALRAPIDLIADVDYEVLDSSTKELVDKYATRAVKDIRVNAGLSQTPQLIIYFIDKNSKGNGKLREDLNALEDIIGICINVPGGRRGTTYGETISIKFENTLFDNMGDVEDN